MVGEVWDFRLNPETSRESYTLLVTESNGVWVALVIALSLGACSNSERFSPAPSSDELYIPASAHNYPPSQAQSFIPPNAHAAPAVRNASFVAAAAGPRPPFQPWDAPSRAQDALPDAYYGLSPRVQELGQRLDAPRATWILVEKAAHRLTLYQGNRILASFPVALGDPYGDKRYTGDKRTPEGTFTISCRHDLGETGYHRALCISYGHAIEIHGLPNQFPVQRADFHPDDWTVGCMGLNNQEMDFVFRVVGLGTPITIRA